jgi:hypothetical protein
MWVLIPLSVISSCSPGKEKKTSGSQSSSEASITIHRYEKALFPLDKNSLKPGLASISREYSLFLGNDWQDSINLMRISNYLNDTAIQELYRLVISKYPDVSFLKKDLDDAFTRYRESFPGVKFPVVYTYVSGLDVDNPVIYADTAMVISLDLFLGSSVLAYKKAGIPEYKIQRLNSDHLMPVCMQAVANTLVAREENKLSLLDQMVAAGKMYYFLDYTLPDVKDEFKIGYSQAQLDWCNNNEGNIWAFLIGNQVLYSSDSKMISKLMIDAPFTSGFVKESPGRLGEWVGWQIVKAYMQENSSVLLPELMKNTDAQSILKGSKYKPRK